MPVSAEHESEYRRLVISYWDLDEAVGFVSALSRLTVRSGDTTAYAEALSQAFVVAYMRPFKNSNRGQNTARLLEPESFTMSASQRRWHDRIEKARDQTVAHSDPSPLRLDIEDHPTLGPIPSMREPRVPYSTDAAVELLELAISIRDQVTARIAAHGTHVSFRE